MFVYGKIWGQSSKERKLPSLLFNICLKNGRNQGLIDYVVGLEKVNFCNFLVNHSHPSEGGECHRKGLFSPNTAGLLDSDSHNL